MKYGFFPGCAYKTAAGYEESVTALNTRLGVELIEIEDWNCCGATAGFSVNRMTAMVLAARLMALAQKQGFSEIVTVCNACYATLKKAEHKLSRDKGLIAEVNPYLQTDNLRLEAIVPVRHYMDVLIDDLKEENWPQSVNNGFAERARIAVYYGCQYTRPYGKVPHTERPDRLEPLLKKIGLSPVMHSAKTLCCGASHIISYEKDCIPLISKITGEMQHKGANLITTICPMCQFNLDHGQQKMSGSKLPVTYFTQVIGLALGIAPEVLGLNKLLIPLKMSWNQ